MPVFSCKEVVDKYAGVTELKLGEAVMLGGFKVQPMEVPHSCQCYAYLIQHEEIGKLLFVTDCVRFNFHRKLGVFSPEARGRVRNLNAPETAEYAQTATAFNFLLAYIGAAEKKPIPPLQIFSSGRQPAIELKDKIGWFAVNVSGNKVIALGKAREHSGSWLYFLLCLESQNTEIFPAVISKIRNF